MDPNSLVDATLMVWFVGSAVLLTAVEAFCVWMHIPTISERLQNLGRGAKFLPLVVGVIDAIALWHFFPTPGVVAAGFAGLFLMWIFG